MTISLWLSLSVRLPFLFLFLSFFLTSNRLFVVKFAYHLDADDFFSQAPSVSHSSLHSILHSLSFSQSPLNSLSLPLLSPVPFPLTLSLPRFLSRSPSQSLFLSVSLSPSLSPSLSRSLSRFCAAAGGGLDTPRRIRPVALMRRSRQRQRLLEPFGGRLALLHSGLDYSRLRNTRLRQGSDTRRRRHTLGSHVLDLLPSARMQVFCFGDN